MSGLKAQRRDLQALHARQRLREVMPRRGLDFASNDYLGLANSPELRAAARDALERGVPMGSGGSRLLRGNHLEHEALEAEAAAFFGSETALFFSSGFAANSTLVSTLPQRGDRIFYDELVHASVHDGLRLSRAMAEPVRHNDPEAFAEAVARWRKDGGTGRPWLIVESLYSMEGDRAPLAGLAAVARHQDAMLVIDEAHATGVFGSSGRGLAADLEGEEQVITVRTCGKALGCEGALVCGSRTLRDFLVNRGRGFIFSTAPSPLMAALVRASLQLVAMVERRKRLHQRIALANTCLAAVGATPSGSQIVPLVIGEDARTMEIAQILQERGFDVRGIRPPTVPEGTSRLRISLTLNTDDADLHSLCDTLAELGR